MAQTLRALFGNLVLPKRDERVELYSKLGGALIGSMRKQRPDEAHKDFVKRVKKHAARLMPHHLGFTWKCIELEISAHKVLVAWDDDKAKQIVRDKYKCYAHHPDVYCIRLGASPTSLVPEVAVYQSTTSCSIEGKYSSREPEFCNIKALSGLPSLKCLRLEEGDYDLQSLTNPSLSKLALHGVRVKNILTLPTTLTKLMARGVQHPQVAFRDFVNCFALIEKLELDGNNMTGSLPSEISRLNLATLKVARANLSNTIPASLGSIQTLKKLDLSGNLLEGCIPSELAGLQRLTVLNLSNNQLSGEIPTSLVDLQLKVLDLSQNQLSGEICQLDALRLEVLDLSHNKLTGSVPTYGEALFLSKLCLQHNNLTGCIPSSLARLRTVMQFNFSYNRLTGSIPSEFGNLTNFDFDASHNRLLGRLPFELLDDADFTRLDLSHNRFWGSLPRELVLRDGATLCLQHNCLTGNYPTCINASIKHVDLSYNYLCGRVPRYNKKMTTFECSNNVNDVDLEVLG